MSTEKWKYIFVSHKLPLGQELINLADELGISRFGLDVQVGASRRLNEAELQSRVQEAIRTIRDSMLWLIAFASALASVFSALTAWWAVWNRLG